MRAKTHIAFAAAAITFASTSVPALLMAVVGICADWDFWFKRVQHRTWSHSLVIVGPLLGLAVLAAERIGTEATELALCAAIAYASHPFIDLLNRSPVYLLYPIRTPFRMFKRVSIRVGSVGEEAVFWLSLTFVVGMTFVAARGWHDVRALDGGVVFRSGAWPQWTSTLQREHAVARADIDSTNARLRDVRVEIAAARQDSLTFSAWPATPSKVQAASKQVTKLTAEAWALQTKLDTLRAPTHVKGVHVPLPL